MRWNIQMTPRVQKINLMTKKKNNLIQSQFSQNNLQPASTVHNLFHPKDLQAPKAALQILPQNKFYKKRKIMRFAKVTNGLTTAKIKIVQI